MDKEIDLYLEKVARGLSGVPQTDKNEIIQEIRNHIYEATKRQESLKKILDNLGDPTKLAKSYKNSYSLENNNLKLSDVFNNIAFYASVGFSGIIVIPILSSMAAVFVLAAIFILGLSVLNLFGVTNAPFNIGFMLVTGYWQVFMAIVISAILCLIASVCWNGLKKYLKYVSRKYHTMRIEKY